MTSYRSNIYASIRFLLIFYIIQGHFIQVVTSNRLVLSLFKQHNFIVGCFFLLSGFLLAVGQKNKHKAPIFWPWCKKRLKRIYPVHLAVLLLFSPLFVAVDVYYGATILDVIKNAFIVIFLFQAWIPDWALLWNSPTWFLSALVFCYFCFPLIFSFSVRRTSSQLVLIASIVFSVLLILKLFYSLENGFLFLEGLKAAPTVPYFNFLRFNPLINCLEFSLGIFTGIFWTRTEHQKNFRTTYMPVLSLSAVVLLMIVRTMIPLNDMVARTLLLTPLFLCFLFFSHSGYGRFLHPFESPLWNFLGTISFSLYVIHGALGQLFYKRAIRVLFEIPDVPYYVFLVASLLGGAILYYGIEKRGSQLFSLKRV